MLYSLRKRCDLGWPQVRDTFCEVTEGPHSSWNGLYHRRLSPFSVRLPVEGSGERKKKVLRWRKLIILCLIESLVFYLFIFLTNWYWVLCFISCKTLVSKCLKSSCEPSCHTFYWWSSSNLLIQMWNCAAGQRRSSCSEGPAWRSVFVVFNAFQRVAPPILDQTIAYRLFCLVHSLPSFCYSLVFEQHSRPNTTLLESYWSET